MVGVGVEPPDRDERPGRQPYDEKWAFSDVLLDSLRAYTCPLSDYIQVSGHAVGRMDGEENEDYEYAYSGDEGGEEGEDVEYSYSDGEGEQQAEVKQVRARAPQIQDAPRKARCRG